MPKQQLYTAAYHLKPSEVNKIILATNSFRDRCLVKTLYWAGLRRSEIQNLDIRDIDFNRKRITLTGKGNKTRVVPIINDEFLSDLKHLIGAKRQGFVFCYNEGKQFSFMVINNILAKAGRRAGIRNPNPRLKHIDPHIFRHSISRYLKNKGFKPSRFRTFWDMHLVKRRWICMGHYLLMKFSKRQNIGCRNER